MVGMGDQFLRLSFETLLGWWPQCHALFSYQRKIKIIQIPQVGRNSLSSSSQSDAVWQYVSIQCLVPRAEFNTSLLSLKKEKYLIFHEWESNPQVVAFTGRGYGCEPRNTFNVTHWTCGRNYLGHLECVMHE